MIVLPKLIIIRGNSGSGKTTLAREIHNRLPRNTLLISQDTVRRDMLRVKDGKNTLGLPLFKDLLQYGYQYCNYVILEGILNAEWYAFIFLHVIIILMTEKSSIPTVHTSNCPE